MTRKIVLSGILLCLAASTRAEDVWIKRQADVRADASAAADAVAPVQKGQKVHLVERSGPWVKVDLGGGKVGWLAADSVSNREVKPDTNLIGRSSAAEMSS